MLFSASLMELLSNVSLEDIEVLNGDNYMLFTTKLDTIYAPKYVLNDKREVFPINTIVVDNDGVFPITAIDDLIYMQFTSTCSVSRSALLNVLDRIMLFVTPFDKRSVNLSFTENGLQVTSRQADCDELLPYTNSDNFTPYVCSIDVLYLKEQVSTISSKDLTIYYGNDTAIKLEDGISSQVIALFQDDEF